ncbi:hypothetical protein FACS18949_15550 [Clostridia bacterium]|nr:hypothetical protein FACS189425_10440 [Clostridia bacterium]GHV36298.1 hypothetical protein FACS18949_15550 [Clostridia bacterium]
MSEHNKYVDNIAKKLPIIGHTFTAPPIVIGGMAMEYYGIRKSGADIDLVIRDEDYQILANTYPDKRKDIYGDLGVVIESFEIWRSIALLDYEFFATGAIDWGAIKIVSLDRLLFSRVSAMEVEKYRNDLDLIKQYYYDTFRNGEFCHEAETHIPSYELSGGVVLGGKYI